MKCMCVVNAGDMVLMSQGPFNGGSCEEYFIICIYLWFALHVTVAVCVIQQTDSIRYQTFF